MDEDKRISKVTVEYDDDSKAVYEGTQLFLVIVDDRLELFNIETTSEVGEEKILDFANNTIRENKERELMRKVKPSKSASQKQHKRAVPSYLKVVK